MEGRSRAGMPLPRSDTETTTHGLSEAILGIIRHAAAALAREGWIGDLRPGAACDLMLLDATSEVDLAYHYGVNLCAQGVKRSAVSYPASSELVAERRVKSKTAPPSGLASAQTRPPMPSA